MTSKQLFTKTITSKRDGKISNLQILGIVCSAQTWPTIVKIKSEEKPVMDVVPI